MRKTLVTSIELLTITLIIVLIVLSLTRTIMFAVVEGKSMEPILQTGDLVIVVKKSVKALKVGDVIVYERPSGEFIIHRIVNILKLRSGLIIIPKGDNNPVPDGEIPSSWIVGEVLEVNNAIVKFPGLGYVTLSLRALEASIIRALTDSSILTGISVAIPYRLHIKELIHN